ncbi:venom peptide isomerase heavy chain-like [Uloborus diversus]|uniref:venom peptide isomerase heavy chain-like n=1 Tax=Uloborus diversus TaxID=327109 RepID=UPI00240A8ECD|nr:venom peptide isomerase heavy chain-like [Uloborus diversus]
MKLFLLVGILCILELVNAIPLTVENCGKSFLYPDASDRIVGGGFAQPGMYPWMASLHIKYAYWAFDCGASVLNEHWVITAAHCFDGGRSPEKYKIHAGIHKLSESYHATVQEYRVSDIYVHPGYQKGVSLSNDIALVRTLKKIDIAGSGGYINGICLPQNSRDPTGQATATGWGFEWHNGEMTDILKYVRLPLVDRKTCNNAYDQNPYDAYDAILPNMICAGEENKDTCSSDSGGPLFQRDQNGISTLIGITSFGAECGSKTHPGVYTKVGYYLDWIKKIIQTRDP